MLRQKDEPKNKNEKKITETGIETKLKPASFLSTFKTVQLSEQEDVTVIPSLDFT